MNTKEILYVVGFISTFTISLLSLYISQKNRRNALREHLYKEQISFFLKLVTSLNILNREIDSVFNVIEKNNQNRYHEILEEIANVFYDHEFIIPSEISLKIKHIIVESNKFYLSITQGDRGERNDSYLSYYNKYDNLIDSVKSLIGTDTLSSENRRLHSKLNTLSSIQFRKIIEDITSPLIANYMK